MGKRERDAAAVGVLLRRLEQLLMLTCAGEESLGMSIVAGLSRFLLRKNTRGWSGSLYTFSVCIVSI